MRSLLFFSLILIVSCSPRFKVGSDFDPAVDFNKYQTFRKDQRNLFTKRSNPILNSELTRKRIDYAISQELATKGYEQTEQNPDLIFSYQTEVKNKQEVQQVNNNPTWGYYRYYPTWGFPNQTYVRDYEESTLIIDIKDAKSNELVWQGWVIGELKYSEKDWAERINETVRQALSKFPSKLTGKKSD